MRPSPRSMNSCEISYRKVANLESLAVTLGWILFASKHRRSFFQKGPHSLIVVHSSSGDFLQVGFVLQVGFEAGQQRVIHGALDETHTARRAGDSQGKLLGGLGKLCCWKDFRNQANAVGFAGVDRIAEQ